MLCTVPDASVGEAIARHLVEDERAACVNIVPGVRSIYRWQGAVHDDAELLLLVKTTAAGFESVRAAIRALHPYDVPEIVALPLVDGDPAYLGWLRAGVRGRP